MNKLKAKATVESVVSNYELDVTDRLESNLQEFEDQLDSIQIAIIAFKKERILEVYARKFGTRDWKKIKKYDFTSYSGKLGPKLKEGDKQIPEGIYKVESLNPNSSYHLSLRVNYPNEFDKKMAKLDGRTNLGSDIMIHGKDVTIGCIPIGDKNIEELFILAARSFKYSIPIIISPIDFRINDAYNLPNDHTWQAELYYSIKKELEEYN